MLDVIVVGGGPAGLSAALMLGRCRRRVLICDTGQPRNRHSQALHGYLTRDGVPPGAFNTLGAGGARFPTVSSSVRSA
jgi:thioredoxin reductase